jgi:hypothetical protein
MAPVFPPVAEVELSSVSEVRLPQGVETPGEKAAGKPMSKNKRIKKLEAEVAELRIQVEVRGVVADVVSVALAGHDQQMADLIQAR